MKNEKLKDFEILYNQISNSNFSKDKKHELNTIINQFRSWNGLSIFNDIDILKLDNKDIINLKSILVNLCEFRNNTNAIIK